MKHLDHEEAFTETEEDASWRQEDENKYVEAATAMANLASDSLEKPATLKVEALNFKTATEFTNALNQARWCSQSLPSREKLHENQSTPK